MATRMWLRGHATNAPSAHHSGMQILMNSDSFDGALAPSPQKARVISVLVCGVFLVAGCTQNSTADNGGLNPGVLADRETTLTAAGACRMRSIDKRCAGQRCVVQMRGLITHCGSFSAALDAAQHAISEATSKGVVAARTFWFEPGGDYRIAETVAIYQPGVTLMGGGAFHIFSHAPTRWNSGTVIRCPSNAMKASSNIYGQPQSCLRIQADDVRLQNMTFLAGSPAGGSVALPGEHFSSPMSDQVLSKKGAAAFRAQMQAVISVEKVERPVLADLSFFHFPSTAVYGVGLKNGLFDRLVMVGKHDGTGDSQVALYLRDGDTNRVQHLVVGKVQLGVLGERESGLYVGDAEAADSRMHGVALVDPLGGFLVENCRFDTGREGGNASRAEIAIVQTVDATAKVTGAINNNYFNTQCAARRRSIALKCASGTPDCAIVSVKRNSFFGSAPVPLFVSGSLSASCMHNRIIAKIPRTDGVAGNRNLELDLPLNCRVGALTSLRNQQFHTYPAEELCR
jgi:hypothetical protein